MAPEAALLMLPKAGLLRRESQPAERPGRSPNSRSISGLERPQGAALPSSPELGLCGEKLEKKKQLRILKARRPWALLDYFLSMAAGKACCFAQLAPAAGEQRASHSVTSLAPAAAVGSAAKA